MRVELAFMVYVSGCVEPTFVSLGRNDEAALSVPDAAGPASAPLADAASFPVTFVLGPCPEGPDRVELASECETRRLLTCPLDLPAQETLDGVLSSLLRECGESVNQVRVSFAAGCAERFELGENASERARSARDCIARRLGAERYDCAAELTCAAGATFGVPTSSVPSLPAPLPSSGARRP